MNMDRNTVSFAGLSTRMRTITGKVILTLGCVLFVATLVCATFPVTVTI
jgi:hypothetical protein